MALRAKLVRKSIVWGYAQSARQRAVRRNAALKEAKKESSVSRGELSSKQLTTCWQNNLNCLLLFDIVLVVV